MRCVAGDGTRLFLWFRTAPGFSCKQWGGWNEEALGVCRGGHEVCTAFSLVRLAQGDTLRVERQGTSPGPSAGPCGGTSSPRHVISRCVENLAHKPPGQRGLLPPGVALISRSRHGPAQWGCPSCAPPHPDQSWRCAPRRLRNGRRHENAKTMMSWGRVSRWAVMLPSSTANNTGQHS